MNTLTENAKPVVDVFGSNESRHLFDEFDFNKKNVNTKHGKREVVTPYLMDDSYKGFLTALNKTAVKYPKQGDNVKVKYIGSTTTEYLFASPYKDYVRVEKCKAEDIFMENVEIGTELSVILMNIDEKTYNIKGSVAQLHKQNVCDTLNMNTPVDAKIVSMISAGYNLIISLDSVNIPAFMPNTLAGANKINNPESLIGQTLEVMIESFSDEKGTYIVSRKRYLQTLLKEEIKKLRYNKVYEGTVTGATEFGVFVEFNGCITGMIHKSNIHPEWQNRIHEIEPGTKIDFYVKEIIDSKIILTQIIKETLWDTIKVGQTMKGKVKDTKPFGALIILDEETNGLIHTSELEKLNKKFDNGSMVNVKVLAIDRSKRKIYLTIV